ncbi:MAG: helix-turn-helix transcriptional regulator [Oscillospiraceae bacterium]|nr:helix-turn-helix transcriptional regulator [Oscillospiraceae bacterium]
MTEKEFSVRLAKLREQKGISARDMSLSIGQNPGYINNIENGKSMPSMQGFFYICEFLNISPETFFDETVSYPDKLSDLIEDLKKLDEMQLSAISVILKGLSRK